MIHLDVWHLGHTEKKSSVEGENILGTGPELEYELLDVEDEKFYRGKVILFYDIEIALSTFKVPSI